MTDLVVLAIKVDSTEAGKAAGDLDKLTAAGERTGLSVEQAERHMRKASIALGDVGKSASETSKDLRTASQTADDLLQEMQGLAAGGNKVAGAFVQANRTLENLAHIQAEATREIERAKAAHKAGEIGLEQYKREVLEARSAIALYQKEHGASITAFHKAKAAQEGEIVATNLRIDEMARQALAAKAHAREMVKIAEKAKAQRAAALRQLSDMAATPGTRSDCMTLLAEAEAALDLVREAMR